MSNTTEMKARVPMILQGSPVPFVIVGPVGAVDRVLVRSDDAGLELVAFAAKESGRENPSLGEWYIAGSIHMVHSATAIGELSPEGRRSAVLKFCWMANDFHGSR